MSELETLRAALAAIDKELLHLVAKRREMSKKIVLEKQAIGNSTRDFSQERKVFERAQGFAAAAGLPGQTADELMRLLIDSSLSAQESDRVASQAQGHGKAALVVGGLGNLGAWFAKLLENLGYHVEVVDINADNPAKRRWQDAPDQFAVTVIATPIAVCNEILLEMAKKPRQGVTFDLASLKGPLHSGLHALASAGADVTSIHPMFGPSVNHLSGRHIIAIDVGTQKAKKVARQLFESTMANWVEMSLEEHDRMMAYVLGLSHASNILFADVLSGSQQQVSKLDTVSSTTFNAQLAVSEAVVRENQSLYYDIQQLNQFTDEALASLELSTKRLRASVLSGDKESFLAMMQSGLDFVTRRKVSEEQ